jgi:hypothetical protein
MDALWPEFMAMGGWNLETLASQYLSVSYTLVTYEHWGTSTLVHFNRLLLEGSRGRSLFAHVIDYRCADKKMAI